LAALRSVAKLFECHKPQRRFLTDLNLVNIDRIDPGETASG